MAKAIRARFVTGAPPCFAVRRDDVVNAVAERLGIAVVTDRLRREVRSAVEAMGGQAIKTLNRRLFRCVRPADMDEAAALELGRALRRPGPPVPSGDGGRS